MTIREFGEIIHIDEEAIIQSEKLYKLVESDSDYKELLKEIEGTRPAMEVQEICDKLAEKYSINFQQFRLCVLLTCGDIIVEKFKELGLPEKICFDSAVDITCKANECKNLDGYYGVSPFFWCVRVLRGGIHKLGRLEFEERPSDFDFTINGVSIKKGDTIIGVHIPTEGPMHMDDVYKSFELAYDFYGRNYDGNMIVRCGSWILYPPFVKMFKKGGSLYEFSKLFTMLDVLENDDFKVAWRIFNTRDVSNPDALPQNTSLQRAMVEYIKKGGKAGDGIGVTAFNKNL